MVIVEPVGDILFRIARKGKQGEVHHDLLRPFPESEHIPEWARNLSQKLQNTNSNVTKTDA